MERFLNLMQGRISKTYLFSRLEFNMETDTSRAKSLETNKGVTWIFLSLSTNKKLT